MSPTGSHDVTEADAVVSRKKFLRCGLMVTAAALGGARLFAQAPVASISPGAPSIVPERGPQIESGLVKQFVVAGHSQLEKVKEMLAAQPALINATWDWGGGDFETALGGASHMGRPDIARFLLENNARMGPLCRGHARPSRHHQGRGGCVPKYLACAGASQNSAHCSRGERRR